MVATLADLLECHLASRQLSLGRLAELSGVPKATLGRWSKGRAERPHIAEPLLCVAHALELNRIQASQLLRAAGHPPLDALLAGMTRATREELRPLLARWESRGPTNLPHRRTRFFGREDELVAVGEWLTGRESRLVTLTGPGGAGKTRLALEVADALRDTFPDGVWFAALAMLRDPTLFPALLAEIIGVREEAQDPLFGRLESFLRPRRILLVLDNVEQLPGEFGALIGGLLDAAPDLAILATGRAPLRVYGEQIHPVRPFPTPARDTPPAALAHDPAIALFVARARAVSPGFALTERNAAAVADLCARLDGLPLALELAAARCQDRTPREVLAHFPLRLDLGADGPRDVPARHQALRETTAWSHDLLPAARQRLFARLAPFAGGVTPAAARAVCSDGADAAGALDGELAALADAALLERANAPGEPPRYRFLEAIREYAEERLAARGEGDRYRARHLAWCVGLATAGGSFFVGGDAQAGYLTRLDAERDNLRAALDWAGEHDPAIGLRLATALAPYWYIRHAQPEGRAYLETIIERAGRGAAGHRAALHALGFLRLFHDARAARAALEEALDATGDTGAGTLPTEIRCALAYACYTTGDLDAAAAYLEAIAPAETGDELSGVWGVADLLRGYLAMERGEMTRADELLGVALRRIDAAGLLLFRCMALARRGDIALRRGDRAGALAHYAALREAAERLGAPFYRILAQFRLGMVHEWAGDDEAADAAYARCLALDEREAGDPVPKAASLLGRGRIALRRGEVAEALAPLRASADIAERLHDRRLTRQLALPLGLALWRTGQRASAVERLSEAMEGRAAGDPALLAAALEAVSALAIDAHDTAHAARWLDVAARLRIGTGVPPSPAEEAQLRALRERLATRQGADTTREHGVESTPDGGVIAAEVIAWLRERR